MESKLKQFAPATINIGVIDWPPGQGTTCMVCEERAAHWRIDMLWGPVEATIAVCEFCAVKSDEQVWQAIVR